MTVSHHADIGDARLTIDPDDDMRAPSPAGSGMRFWAALAVAGVAVAGFAGVVGYGYLAYSGRDAQGPIPVVRSDPRPDKVKPDDPGGQKVPHQGINVFDLGQRSARETPAPPPNPQARGMERLLPPPETVLPKPLPAPPPVVAAPPATSAPAQTPVHAALAPPHSATPAHAALSPAVASGPGPMPPPPRPGSVAATRPAVKPAGPTTLTTASLPSSEATSSAVAAGAGTPSGVTAARPAAGAGGVRLQVAALRTDEEARLAWSRLQRKHADVLGALTPTITRVDLANR
ncbi:MAG: hypothetical protein FJX57_10380, partial [Alphaproteobacteria bacterium]|nr:hypothetical protein [Alphaproteobacteria bacterium]